MGAKWPENRLWCATGARCRALGARSWLDGVRAASIAIGSIEAELAGLYEPGTPDGGGVESGSIGDGGMFSRMLRACELRRRCETAEAIVGLALRVIEGVRLGMGERYAEVLDMRYVDAMPWDEVAERCGCSERTARRVRDVACDYIDSVGLAGAARGEPPAGGQPEQWLAS